MWQYRGHKRPDFATVPGPGQESVWDYPRPPKLASDSRLVEVYSGDQVVVSSVRTCRVLETASPPSFYIPPQDVNWGLLVFAPGSSVCEWKGATQYWTPFLQSSRGHRCWSYPDPTLAFEQIRDYISFYPAAIACYVSGERVRAQSGQFYGGWITGDIVGPFKEESGNRYSPKE